MSLEPENENVNENVNAEAGEPSPLTDTPAAAENETATPEIPATQEERVVYRWDYREQRAAAATAATAERRKSLGIYIGLVCAMFAVCLGVLIAVLIIGGKATAVSYLGGHGTRVVYVHDADDREGIQLTPEEVALSVYPSVVGIRSLMPGTMFNEGAGIILSEDGLILTNYHVVKDANTVNVYLYGEEDSAHRAQLVGASPEYDLALLSITASGLQPAKFADSGLVVTGDTVFAVGHPGGLEFGWSFSDGIISSTQRTVLNDYGHRVSVIQSNVTVNTGNSGGPLVNADGEVIGVVTMKLNGDYYGVNFAIPGNDALEVAERLKEVGGDTKETDVINRPYIGFTGCTAEAGNWLYYDEATGDIYTVKPEYAELMGATYMETDGVWVISVMENSGSYGKLEPGDVIIGVDGQTVAQMEQVISIVSNHRAGDEIAVRFLRDGTEHAVDIVLTKQD